MVEEREDIIRKNIEIHLDYLLSTSDDAQKQIQYLLSADLGASLSQNLLGILVGSWQPPQTYLDRVNSHGKSLLRTLLDVFFSFENITRLANDESIKESPMFNELLNNMNYYYLRPDLYVSRDREETPMIRFDPWPWLDYLLNDYAKDTDVLSIDEQHFAFLKVNSLEILLYASMYCCLDKEKHKLTQYLDHYKAVVFTGSGTSKRFQQCRGFLEWRLDGNSLIELVDDYKWL